MTPVSGADGFRRIADALAQRPFAIGLAPFDAGGWIESDDQLGAELALKRQILATEGAEAFAALPGAEAAQSEVLAMLAAHLTARFPAIYRREGEAIRVSLGDRLVSFGGEPPLLTASRLVQEDLLLMRRELDHWRLAAGSLCFPSTWRLSEKLGQPLEAIHAPVPGYQGRMASRVARIFDHLEVEIPLQRFNLSIYGDGRLRHAETRQPPDERFPPDHPILDRAHVRVERQALRKLPTSGAILFTVRVRLDSFAALARRADGPALALALHEHLAALTPVELAYKGLTVARERLLEALGALSRPDR